MPFFIIGLVVVGGIVYCKMKFGSRTVKVKPKYVDCIKYEDFFYFHKSQSVQEELKRNPNLDMFVEKKSIVQDGKEMLCISTGFFDKLKQRIVAIKDAPVFVSETMDKMMEDEFNGRSIFWF